MAISSVLGAVKRCPGKNMVFSQCGGESSCWRTCENLNKSLACKKVCRSGCVCKEGFIRNDAGECIEPSQCPGPDEDAEATEFEAEEY